MFVYVQVIFCHAQEGRVLLKESLKGLSVTQLDLQDMFSSEDTVKSAFAMINNPTTYIK